MSYWEDKGLVTHPPIKMSGNVSPLVSATSPLSISPNPLERKVSNGSVGLSLDQKVNDLIKS